MDKQLRYHRKHVHDLPIERGFVRLWDAEGAVNGSMIESAFRAILKTEFVWPYIALMPDYHPGEDAMIGSVIPTRDVLLPSVIGGDLGCGMTAVALPITAEQIAPRLHVLDRLCRERIPVGTSHNTEVTRRVSANPIWDRGLKAPLLTNRLHRKLRHQFGSVGGGNHFLEFQRDEEDRVWIMLHSGSRYLGVTVRDYYVEKGKDLEEIDARLYAKVPHLPVETELAQDYLTDLRFVMDFARASRREMLTRSLECVGEAVPGEKTVDWPGLIDTAEDIVHNFIAPEEYFGQRLFLHRKGAIHLQEGRLGFIPGSMGTRSYVVEGRGNEFGFCSGSHGAGRAMSRGDAFRTISDEDFRRSMEGVLHGHDPRLKDEAPGAYKDVRHVMRSQKDLVKIMHELQPILSIKGC